MEAASAEQRDKNRTDRHSGVWAPLPAVVQPRGLATAKSKRLVLVWGHPLPGPWGMELWTPHTERNKLTCLGAVGSGSLLLDVCL